MSKVKNTSFTKKVTCNSCHTSYVLKVIDMYSEYLRNVGYRVCATCSACGSVMILTGIPNSIKGYLMKA